MAAVSAYTNSSLKTARFRLRMEAGHLLTGPICGYWLFLGIYTCTMTRCLAQVCLNKNKITARGDKKENGYQ